MNVYSKLFIIAISLVTISCSKHKSPKWITGEFNIIDSETKEPVEANLKLSYYEGSIMGSWETTEDIGATDENGYFKLQQKVNKRDQQFKLEVYAKGWYGTFGYILPAAVKELSERGKNIYTIEVTPIYAYELILNNTSCYDETDSVWISRIEYPGTGPVYTGCLDNFSTGEITRSTSTPNSSLRTISKKNGIYDTIIHPFSLTQGMDNTVTLNY